MRLIAGFALSLTAACFCPRPCPPTCPAPEDPPASPCLLPPCNQIQADQEAWIKTCVPTGQCQTYTCPGTDNVPVTVCNRG